MNANNNALDVCRIEIEYILSCAMQTIVEIRIAYIDCFKSQV